MLNTVPFHPALTDGLFNHKDPQADKIAWITGTTPERALAYLSHQTDDHSPPPGLTKCPLIQICVTECARTQREDQTKFPLTRDGNHLSCSYWTFLSVHAGSLPEIRESAAHATLRSLTGKPETKPRQQRRKPAATQTRTSPKSAEQPAPEHPRPLQTALF